MDHPGSAPTTERRARGPAGVHEPRNGRRRLIHALWAVARAGRYGRLHGLAVDRLFAGESDAVLDLACGAGMNFGALVGSVGHEGRVVGVDARGGAIRRARQEATGLGEGCSVVRSDAGSLPFPDATFDRAFGTSAVGAGPDGATVSEVARVLRPGGRFVLLRARPFPALPLAFLGPFVGAVIQSSEVIPGRSVESIRSLLAARFDTVHVEPFGGSMFVATAERSA